MLPALLSRSLLKSTSRAFTLIELIVVIIVISILATLAAVSYTAVIDRTEASKALTAQQSVAREVSALLAFGDISPVNALEKAYADLPAQTMTADNWAITFDNGWELVADNGDIQPTSNRAVWTADTDELAWRVSATDTLEVHCVVTLNNISYNCDLTDTPATPGDTELDPGNTNPPTAPPAAPTGLTATGGHTTAVITFTRDPNATNYTATCRAAGQPDQTGVGTSSPVTVLGLINGITYSCEIEAHNIAGTSAPSAPVEATPTAVALGAIAEHNFDQPAAPAPVNASQLGTTQVGGYQWNVNTRSAAANYSWALTGTTLRAGGTAWSRLVTSDFGVADGIATATFGTNRPGGALVILASPGPIGGLAISADCTLWRLTAIDKRTTVRPRSGAEACGTGTTYAVSGRTLLAAAPNGSTIFTWDIPDNIPLGTHWGVGWGGSPSSTSHYVAFNSFKLEGLDAGTPAEPLSFDASAITNGVALHWEAIAQPHLAGFHIYRDDNLIHTAAAGDRTYIDDTATPGVAHTWRIDTADIWGNTSNQKWWATTTLGQETLISDTFTRTDSRRLGRSNVGDILWENEGPSGNAFSISNNTMRVQGGTTAGSLAGLDAGTPNASFVANYSVTRTINARTLVASASLRAGVTVAHNCRVDRYAAGTSWPSYTSIRASVHGESCGSGTEYEVKGRTLVATSSTGVEIFTMELPAEAQLGSYWGFVWSNAGGGDHENMAVSSVTLTPRS